MISNPSKLFYTCIAKGTVILADYTSKEHPGIESIALKCIENTPPHHSIFSHTLRKKTYTFSIDDSFVYFSIVDESMEKSESFWLLNRLKSFMKDLMIRHESDLINHAPHCLQSKLDPIFAEIVGTVDVDLELDLSVVTESRNLSIDSSKGRKTALIPLLGKPLNALKKKKKKPNGEVVGDVEVISDKKTELCGNGGNNGVSRKELRNGLLSDHHHKQKAKQVWKKHVWIVLVFDFCICAVLFGIWLWICEGFQCING